MASVYSSEKGGGINISFRMEGVRNPPNLQISPPLSSPDS